MKNNRLYHRVITEIPNKKYKYILVEKEKPYYETLGLRYTILGLECVYIGYQVKAHLLKADCMALSVGIRLEKLKNGVVVRFDFCYEQFRRLSVSFDAELVVLSSLMLVLS